VKRLNRLSVIALLLALTSFVARADTPDPTTIVTNMTTLFGLVAALVISIVGFFIGVRIVKGIRK
jgi:hypothetical protein